MCEYFLWCHNVYCYAHQILDQLHAQLNIGVIITYVHLRKWQYTILLQRNKNKDSQTTEYTMKCYNDLYFSRLKSLLSLNNWIANESLEHYLFSVLMCHKQIVTVVKYKKLAILDSKFNLLSLLIKSLYYW